MARLVTVQSILDKARMHADMRNSSFFSDAELLDLFNDVYPEVYDELVGIDENYYSVESAPIAISNASQYYSLPDDFYKMTGVDFMNTPGQQRITVERFNEAERNVGFSSAGSLPNGFVVLRYVPACPVFTDPTQTLDGVSGWDRLVALALAIDMLDSEESSTVALSTKYAKRMQQMIGSLDRDIGSPATVSDVSVAKYPVLYNNVRYNLFGSKLQLVSTEFIGAFGTGSF